MVNTKFLLCNCATIFYRHMSDYSYMLFVLVFARPLYLKKSTNSLVKYVSTMTDHPDLRHLSLTQMVKKRN